MSHGVDVSQGTKAVPSYIAADAETTPLPKIVIPEPPPPPPPVKRSLQARLGDLPMRVIYRLVASGVVVVLAAAAGVVFLVTRDDRPAPAAAAPLSTSVPVRASAPSMSAGPSSPVAASPSSTSTPHPRMSPLAATLADRRLPRLPGVKKLRALPGRSTKVKKWIEDGRSHLALPRLTGRWKVTGASPFATRQVLPLATGAGHRALLVSCPVPIIVQHNLRDTAVIAARWTLNHQPDHATIRWVASQPLKVGKQDGWLLAYQVRYVVRGKKRLSMAALVVVDVPDTKPGLLFMSIPDSQKKYWRDINTVVSTLKVA